VAARFLALGDTAFSVEFGRGVDPEVNARVRGLNAALHELRARGGLAGLIETIPSFRALLVLYDPLRTSRAELEAAVRPLVEEGRRAEAEGALWRLPVCYGGEFGPDLEDVAERTGLTPERVVELHAGATFTVYMLGFMPGLAYMGGLPKELHLPRRSNPRTRLPAGSVAIATELSIVYPWESPGGWHLLGRTPVRMFDPRHEERPVLLAPGDRVRFVPQTREEFEEMGRAVAADEFDARGLREEEAPS
jgi:inhibitor of KinA